jgi:two-component system OmpR family sensor kinase
LAHGVAGALRGLSGLARRVPGLVRGAPARIEGAFDRLPIRTRLAAASALLTFAILCVFAVLMGFLIANRMRSDFNRTVAQNAEQVVRELEISVVPTASGPQWKIEPPLEALAAASQHAVIKLYTAPGPIPSATVPFDEYPRGTPFQPSPSLGGVNGLPLLRGGLEVASTAKGYQVETLRAVVANYPEAYVIVQYGQPVSDVEAAIARVELFLALGVLAGTGLALLAGTMIARRAMAPIAALTSRAAQIARTRDRSLTMPDVQASDEVSELARTLGGMLRELDAAHADTEAMLERQRQFVADASHELRTPLTSVLANLELLAESLHGEAGEASRSALRSSQRMRRLVADLLLLARSDVGRVSVRGPVNLAGVAVDAAAELGPMSTTHEVALDVKPAVVEGSRDELERLTINLIENALRHTPPGTEIWVRTDTIDGQATLVVEDNGPGIPEQLAATLFERFVRGAGDRGGSFGLGLAIVRAVAQTHGGTVAVERTRRDGAEHGARFVVRLPAAAQAAPPAQRAAAPAQSGRDERDRRDERDGRDNGAHPRAPERTGRRAAGRP